jgi:hypothetical protein
VLVAAAQIGVAPVQVAFVRHWTHLLVVVLQTAVLPTHLVASVLVHCTHAPLAAQAARVGSLRPVQSASTTHAWHFSLVPQIGADPPQLAEVVHWTQVLVVVSQTGAAPVHDVLAVVAVHWTH